MMRPSTTNPLKGIRVLELGQFIAGPFAGLQLADLGAQVIKIERPGQGDPFRASGLGSQAAGYSHNFCAFNRNKLSLTIDLGDARGRDVFRRAASRSDVVLENFRPGVMKRLGLIWARVSPATRWWRRDRAMQRGCTGRRRICAMPIRWKPRGGLA